MAITMVECDPGSEQPMHSHPEAEQVYVVVTGHGLMRVDDEEQPVGPGSLVFIPPGAKHAIRNVGSDQLTYVSATSPPFRMPEPGSAFAYGPAPGNL
jgi:mannose-6-phosphate isomerase-like protein (cupin superfamily)